MDGDQQGRYAVPFQDGWNRLCLFGVWRLVDPQPFAGIPGVLSKIQGGRCVRNAPVSGVSYPTVRFRDHPLIRLTLHTLYGDNVVDILSLILIAVVVLIAIGIAATFISIYNRFFSLKNSAEATLGQVKVAMKKRLDMIEQLLGAVKSYAAFEKETLTGVTAMRARIGSAGPGDLNDLERESRSARGPRRRRELPDPKTSQTVQDLMGAVRGIEDEIARQRYTYNNIAQQYNTMTDTIPSNLVAGVMGFEKLQYLEFGEEIERTPTISF